MYTRLNNVSRLLHLLTRFSSSTNTLVNIGETNVSHLSNYTYALGKPLWLHIFSCNLKAGAVVNESRLDFFFSMAIRDPFKNYLKNIRFYIIYIMYIICTWKYFIHIDIKVYSISYLSIGKVYFITYYKI